VRRCLCACGGALIAGAERSIFVVEAGHPRSVPAPSDGSNQGAHGGVAQAPAGQPNACGAVAMNRLAAPPAPIVPWRGTDSPVGLTAPVTTPADAPAPETSAPTHCDRYGQPLPVQRPGRIVCEGCRTADEPSGMVPGSRKRGQVTPRLPALTPWSKRPRPPPTVRVRGGHRMCLA